MNPLTVNLLRLRWAVCCGADFLRTTYFFWIFQSIPVPENGDSRAFSRVLPSALPGVSSNGAMEESYTNLISYLSSRLSSISLIVTVFFTRPSSTYASVLIVPASPKTGNAQARSAGIIIKINLFILQSQQSSAFSAVKIDELFPNSTIAICQIP